MEESVYEQLIKLSNILHWLGKYQESNMIIALARFSQRTFVEDVDDLIKKLDTREHS